MKFEFEFKRYKNTQINRTDTLTSLQYCMIFSHLVRASLSSLRRKFSINLLSLRLKSTEKFSLVIVPSYRNATISFDDFELLAKPRGLEQISHTTLADEFS